MSVRLHHTIVSCRASREITAQHYAFLVGEEEFDAAFARTRPYGSGS